MPFMLGALSDSLSCQTLTHSGRYRIKVCSQQGYYVRRTGKRLPEVCEEATTSDVLVEKIMSL